MYLARDKHGRIGRKIPGMGEQAVIAPEACAERTTTVYVNAEQAQADQAYWDNVQRAANAAQEKADADAYANQSAQEAEWKKQDANIAMFQTNIPKNTTDAALKRYYARCVNTPQSQLVSESISPNFSETTQVPGEPFVTATQNSRSDFDIFQLVGNPLTRDGQFGVVTDYDRFVQGGEMENSEVHSTNTIVRKHPRLGRMGSQQMGDWEIPSINWDALTTAVTPALQNVLVQAVAPKPKASTTTIIQQGAPGYSASTPAALAAPGTTMGLPNAVFYGFLGLMGVGVLFLGIRAAKS